MQTKLTPLLHLVVALVMCSCSLVYCNGTATCTIGQLIFAESEENVMWDPTANTTFQQVQDGDIAYFTDKMTYGKDQPGTKESEIPSTVSPTHTIAKRAATKDRRFLWPNGIIYYNISHSYSCEERNVILKALCMWEERTCIRFVQRTTQKDYMTIYPRGGCSSYIGRVGGNQGVSVGRSCFALHTVLHEVGHAIGFFHEQSRPDRDDYIDINYENIIPGAASQFKKLTYDDVDSLGVGYDYNSIMHYDHNLFAYSYELSTIEAKDPSISVGSDRALSVLDIEQTNRLYQCPEVLPSRSTTCPVEKPTIPVPFPELPYPSCGGTIEITLDEWDKAFTIESLDYPTYTQNVDCGWLIRVPKGFQAMITVESMSIKRSSRCRDNYIEMYDSFSTNGYHTGRHCGSLRNYVITSITSYAYVHYHTDAQNSTSGLHGFTAKVEAFDTDECRWPAADSCSHTCNNLPGSFECFCPDGYFLSSNGQVCFDTNECGLGNGGCNHKCVNRGGGYHCECDEGFTLQSDGRTCSTNSTRNIITGDLCEEANCDQLCGVFGDVVRCACQNGYALASDRRQCEDINECATRKGGCDQVCMNTIGSFECSCHEGYHLASDGRGCEDFNECATGNGGCDHTCINTIGSFECRCRQGYKLSTNGKTCEVPFPELPYPSCGGTIEITLDEWDKAFTIESPDYPTYTQNVDCGWLIRVPKGFQAMIHVEPMSIKRSFRCRDDYIEMYDSFTTNGYHMGKHCGSFSNYPIISLTSYAYVKYHTGSSSTRGLQGFRAKVKAFDIDECRWPDSCSHTCNNLPGSFKCSCPDGFLLSSDEKNCIDTNNCEFGNGGCNHKCVNRDGGYHCECNEGFTLQSDGKTCSSTITVDLCEEANCDQLCGVFGGVARCACKVGYVFASDRRQCKDINECASRNGSCDQVCTNTIGSFECSCHEGYHLASDGRGCEDINECATGNGGCAHTCTNTIGSFECSCRQGYKLSANGRVCEDINECATRNGGCEHTCTNTIGSFKCSCRQGYTLSSNGKTCEDIDECRQSNPCSQVCVNTEGSYHCNCRDGYVLQGDGTTCLEETSDTAVPADATVLTSPRGQFQTKNWPQTYPENVNLKWLIRCPSVNQRIDLDFNYRPFGTAGILPECAKDWIKVYDGKGTDSDLLGKFCNYAVPVVRRSSTHELLIVLHAGPKHSPSRKGFKVSYTCVDVSPPRNSLPIMVEEPTVEDTKEVDHDDTDSIEINIDNIPDPQCGAILTESSGSFHSPNWPETYPTDVLCEWTIVLPDDERRVQITFNDKFGIAGNLPECTKDWVKIYDGLGDDADESGPFCYYITPETYESSGHVAKVVLFAGPKHNAARKGFSATYRSV